MLEEDKMKYSDIIQPDDAIEKLIKQLSSLNQSFETTVKSIKSGAEEIVNALKSSSGATKKGREQIDQAAISASRLEKAEMELSIAMSDTGKQIAWLKAQTSDVNKSTVEHNRYINQAISSYDRLKSELKQSVELYKSLTAAERADSQMGQQLLGDIISLKNEISALNKAMTPHIQTTTELEKAQRRLTFLQSEEGKKVLELKAKIRELSAAKKQQKVEVDALTQAEEKLAHARSFENEQLKLYSIQIKEANTEAQLRAQIANSAEGSYNRLSAQYALNKIKLNQMSQAEREAADSGKKLEKETAAIYQQMIKLQEATGNYRLSVGHYQKTWDGLGISISQVVRELPAAVVSLNTFFLGISNNIPMLVDEINRLRAQNKMFQQEGKPTVNITKRIASAFLSWNTALVVGLTVLSAHGKEILQWIGNLFTANSAVKKMRELLQGVNKELETSGNKYGETLYKYKQLQDEWGKLENLQEQEKWIKKNADAFEDFGVKCETVNDAELIFVKGTSSMIESFKARAKAAAAMSLAEKKYNEALVEEIKASTLKTEGPDFWTGVGYMIGSYDTSSFEKGLKDDIKNHEDKAEALNKEGDAYFELSKKYNDYADSVLENQGIDEYEKKEKEKKKKKGREPKDPTDYLNRQEVETRKKYYKSITDLEEKEIEKRKRAITDEYNAEVDELNLKKKKIEKILKNETGEYKKLTKEQVEQALNIINYIDETIENADKARASEHSKLLIDEQIEELRMQEETINLRLSAAKKGSEEELKLKIKAINIARKIALLENSKKPISERQKPEDVVAGFDKQTTTTTTEYDFEAFNQKQQLAQAEFNIERRTQKEITRFRLQQEKERWQEQIALAESGALDWSQTQIDTAKAMVKGIDRELSELDNFMSSIKKNGLWGAILESFGFDNYQIGALTDAANIVIQQLQDIAQAEVDLAQKAVDAANERVDAAKSAYEAEIEARNNGYANNVATTKKELEQEKKRQQEKQRLLEDAQRRQENLNSIIQASSLVTASANLWSSFSTIPVIGPALALSAIATMWTSFAVAKIKAKQATSQSEEYGDGGLEFLEGGSHASGHDINLGVKNKNRKNMRAEGGEALAIINKKHTKKYRKILPSIVESLNKGVFEDKYINAFGNSDSLNILHNYSNNIDISKLENDVHDIKTQNETRYYSMPNGMVIIQHKNVKRIIKN